MASKEPAVEAPAAPAPFNRWGRIVAAVLLLVEAVLLGVVVYAHLFDTSEQGRMSGPLVAFAAIVLLGLVWFSYGVARGVSMAHSGAIVFQVVIIALVVTKWLPWPWAPLAALVFVAVLASYKYVSR